MFAKVGTFIAPTVDGTDTVLSGLTDPKVILLRTASLTAAGKASEGMFSWGAFTYDGGAVQQFYNYIHANEAAATSDIVIGGGITACLKQVLATRAADVVTNDFELRGVSMTSTDITLDWFAAPSAAIMVQYLILGGAGFDAAKIISYNDDAVTDPQSVTVGFAGGGVPDVMMFGGRMDANTSSSRDAATSGGVFIGAAVKDGAARVTSLRETDAQASMVLNQWQDSASPASTVEHSTTMQEQAKPGASGTWPADGVSIDKTISAGTANAVFMVAMKGAFQVALGSTTTLTSGGPQNITAGFGGSTIRAAILWGWNLGVLAGLRSSDTDLGYLFMGSTDGTNEGFCGITDDDGAANAITGRICNDTQALGMYTPPANGTVQALADASFVSDVLRLTYGDLDSVAREFNYLIFGDAPSGGTPVSSSDANGTTTEATTLAAQVASAQANGATTETGTPNAQLATADANGATTETASISVPVAASDGNGAVTETAVVTVAVSQTDSGSGASDQTLAAQLGSTDVNGATTEAASAGVPIAASDSGSGLDAATLKAAYTVTDAGAGTSNQSLTAAIPVTDVNGPTTESITRIGLIASDTNGVPVEAISLSAQIPAADAGIGTDAGTTGTPIFSSDSGTSSETAAIKAVIASTQTAVGTEGQTVNVTWAVADLGSGSDAETIKAVVAVSESAVGIESAIAGAWLSKFSDDFGTAIESAVVQELISTGGGVATGSIVIPTQAKGRTVPVKSASANTHTRTVGRIERIR